ncbi:hypothetical protein [Dyella japonica]|uniref:Uncharacterized protein n=1 Tax=Dyella japonica A8 TaxID=1217721 RepID=A0A075K3M3_9GAMM|nr:hypothetical protein [Dyella japonica]AIF48804.1 hypothetical protein HY57_16915 [Dyella japonica A8]
MWLLFKAELRRFRVAGAIACLAHLVVLGFLSRTTDLAQQTAQTYRIFAACYVLGGLVLGAYQMMSYARPPAWVQLIHRPLPAWRIGVALMAAGAAWIALAVALPILLIAAWQAGMTARVVDLRHWLMPLPALTTGMIGYALGAYVVLANRRVGFGAVVFLLLVWMAHAQAFNALLLQWLVAGYLAALLWIVFRPDRQAIPASAGRLGLVFAPVVFALYLALLTTLKVGLQISWILLGTAPATAAVPPVDSVQESQRATDKALMLQGLKVSRDAAAPQWMTEVTRLEKLERYGPLFDELPVRGQFTNLLPLSFPDAANDTAWTFSHDRMRFVGRGLADDRSDRGTLTPPHAATFATPAMPIAGVLGASDAESVLILNQHSAWRYEPRTHAMDTLLELPAQEVFASPLMRVGSHLAALSDQALYVGNANRRAEGLPVRIPLPGPVSVLGRVSIADVSDGYLVSLTFLRNLRYESFPRVQHVVHVDASGHWRIVATRPLTQDFPVWYRYIGWWLSPLLDRSGLMLTSMFAAQPSLDPIDPVRPPAGILWLAVACALACLAMTVLHARRLRLATRATVAWAIVNAALGPAGLLAFWLVGAHAFAHAATNQRRPMARSPQQPRLDHATP